MHTNQIVIYDPEFCVSESGRQRVLRERRKNVHAFIVGIYDPDRNEDMETPFRITYNPYKYEHFVFADTEEVVYNSNVAKCVTENQKGAIYVN